MSAAVETTTTAAVETFGAFRKIQRMTFPHAIPTHAEKCNLALAASMLQAIAQAEAERLAGREHDFGDLRKVAAKLIESNRKGRERDPTLAELQEELHFAESKMNRRHRRAYRAELRKRGLAAA